jgi:HrpA-like RNA helicase
MIAKTKIDLEDVYEFIDNFENSGLTMASVKAGTGTGKSTMFPAGFYKKGKTIFVVQPTVVAVMSISGWVGGGSGLVPAASVGTAADKDIKYENSDLKPYQKSKTPVVYCTAGHLKNILLNFAEAEKSSAFVDYIFLDEAHFGDLNYDGIMYLYDYIRKKGLPLPKLIMITATPGVYPYPENEVYKAGYEIVRQPVEVIYHTRDYPNLKGSSKDVKDLFVDTAELVIREHENNPVEPDEWDAWAIFCPGKKEIQGIAQELREKTKGTIIISEYGGIERSADIIKYDYVPPNGFRKIVVTTNVAEASITIDDLSCVFDTLVEKVQMQNNSGVVVLTLTNISKTSATQRKGRTGRTKQGRCYRMCTEDYYENNLEFIRKREIERIDPDSLIIELYSRHLEIELIVSDNAIPKKTLVNAKNRLSMIGLLNETQTDVTLAGEWIKRVQLSPRNGMFFWLWAVYSEYNPYIGAVITAVLETFSSGPFIFDGDKEMAADKIIKKNFQSILHKLRASESKSPLFFNVSLICLIIYVFKSIDISMSSLKGFCADNNLNNKQIQACLKQIKTLTMMFSKKARGSNSEDVGDAVLSGIPIGNFDVDYELEKATPFLQQCYADRAYIQGKPGRNRIKTQIDYFVGKIDPGTHIIPLAFFDAETTTYVSLYHRTNQEMKYKIAPERSIEVVARPARIANDFVRKNKRYAR